ncbi:MAG: hypothetical protein ABSF60_16375 [Verrucomicrobiota bacterium]
MYGSDGVAVGDALSEGIFLVVAFCFGVKLFDHVPVQSGYNSRLAFETARPSQAHEANSTMSNPTMNALENLSVLGLLEQSCNTVKNFQSNRSFVQAGLSCV